VSQLLGDNSYRIANLVLSVPRGNEESYARRLHGHGWMNDGERIDAAIQQPVREPHGTHGIADHDRHHRETGTRHCVEASLPRFFPRGRGRWPAVWPPVPGGI